MDKKKEKQKNICKKKSGESTLNEQGICSLSHSVCGSFSPCICFTYSDKVKCDTADEGGCST